MGWREVFSFIRIGPRTAAPSPSANTIWSDGLKLWFVDQNGASTDLLAARSAAYDEIILDVVNQDVRMFRGGVGKVAFDDNNGGTASLYSHSLRTDEIGMYDGTGNTRWGVLSFSGDGTLDLFAGDGTTYGELTLDFITINDSANNMATFDQEGSLFSSGGSVKWNSAANLDSGAADTGLIRDSAGVVKVTNGGAGLGGITAGLATIDGAYINYSGTIVAGAILRNSTGTAQRIRLNANDDAEIRLASTAEINWTDNANVSSGNVDIGLARDSAGLLEVTNGGAGIGSIKAGVFSVLQATASLTTPTAGIKFDNSFTYPGWIQYTESDGGAFYLNSPNSPGSGRYARLFASASKFMNRSASGQYGSIACCDSTNVNTNRLMLNDLDTGSIASVSTGFIEWINATSAVSFHTEHRTVGIQPDTVNSGLVVTTGRQYGGVTPGVYNAATSCGWVKHSLFVSPKATTPVTVTALDSRTCYTDEGSGAEIHFNLPTAVAGLTYTFTCTSANGLQINANTGDTIRVAGSVSAAAGYAETATVGSSLTLLAVNATEWIAISSVGTWSVV